MHVYTNYNKAKCR